MIKFIKYLIFNFPGTIVFVLVVMGGIVFIYAETNTQSSTYSLSGSIRGGYFNTATGIVAAITFFVFILIGIINTGAVKPGKRFHSFKKRKREK